MKITRTQLKKVIKEEIAGILAEQTPKKAGFFKRAFKTKSDEVEKMIRNVGAALDSLERERNRPDPDELDIAHIEIDKFGAQVDDGWYRKMSAATGAPDQRKRVSALRQRAEAVADQLDAKAAAYAAQKSKEEEEYRARKKAQEKDAESSARLGGRAAAEADYEACKRSVEAAIRANRYGTHGNPSEADEARNRCSEQYRMAMKNLRESQNKEGKAKITKSQLKKVIQEEVEKILAEV